MILDDWENVWITADHHFGHSNIIEYCDRPFGNIADMDTTLIQNWNSVIGPGDTVFHLGDFTLSEYEQAAQFFRLLNGYIYILKNDWHHDKRWITPYYINPVVSPLSNNQGDDITLLPPLFILEIPKLGNDGYPLAITLCHYPLAEWDRKHYGAWHLHGHSHGKHQAEGFILDVGVDAMNYYPIKLANVLTLMYERGW